MSHVLTRLVAIQMSRPNPPSPVIQILLILASALAGCVYVPLSTEKYPGELDKPHINEMIGESVQAIETRLGKPTPLCVNLIPYSHLVG